MSVARIKIILNACEVLFVTRGRKSKIWDTEV